MNDIASLREPLGDALTDALLQKGYAALTSVQSRVLESAAETRDLRVSSQTGSGKTVALGIAVREFVLGHAAARKSGGHTGAAAPATLVITPTRELAHQVEGELTWLFAKVPARVASVTGGASYRDEKRNLAMGPSIVVGTPGRLLDHLKQGIIDASTTQAVVLDEADRMLDMGFRDELLAILEHLPEEHRTHLVSATFPREVLSLANRVQNDPISVEGTPLGTANADIEHVIYMVESKDRLGAIIQLLLASPELASDDDGKMVGRESRDVLGALAPTLIFAKTRADVAELARLLRQASFRVDLLSGEMEQRARNRAISAMRNGELDVLVATDVAARGIDVQDIARVIHADPPTDVESYTHRSGRTGRAGRKGESALIVVPPALNRTVHLLTRAGLQYRMGHVPTPRDVLDARDARVRKALTTPAAEASELLAPMEREHEGRLATLAAEIESAGQAQYAITRLLRALLPPQPLQEVRTLTAKVPRQPSARPTREHTRAEGPLSDEPGDWVPFRVSWGREHGADARRLLPMLCRRGNIEGRAIGNIKIGPHSSRIMVHKSVAEAFAAAASERDPRNPRVMIRPESEHDDAAPRAPRGDAGDAAEAPREWKPRAPRADAAEAPREWKPRAPRGDAEAPREWKPRAPRGDAAEAPREWKPRAPRGAAAEAPREWKPRAHRGDAGDAAGAAPKYKKRPPTRPAARPQDTGDRKPRRK